MHLIVMRHGEAGWHTLDRERELTEFGRHGVADVAAQIASRPGALNLFGAAHWSGPGKPLRLRLRF